MNTQTDHQANKKTKEGLVFALLAYCIWGISPIFFKLLEAINTYEIIAQRAIWSLMFLVLLITFTHSWGNIKTICTRPKTLAVLFLTSILIGCNWTIYIWAINHGHMLDASLGYFISPLSSILLAFIFLKERFRLRQWCAILLVILGITIQLWRFGTIPLVGLGVAFSFSFYGLARKKIGVDAQSGLFFETLLLMPVAIIYLLFFTHTPHNAIIGYPLNTQLLLITAGAVTTIPLLFFNAAAIRMKLSTLGLIQYVSPTLVFSLAIFMYHEPINMDILITFCFIWVALLIFIVDSFIHERRG
ncbi:EamA family transporter RarD [Neisseria sp. Ec49-e6-T10]|uniref:EamA family transporter RarD n=1 Tax=Neisseria sp. Ec49-e6-T10 TaxID=3140744 RepID=UPI003EB9E670